MKFKTGLALILIVLGVWSRWIPHIPNFTAIGASALLAGSLLGLGWLAVLVPLASLFVSDALLGFYPGLEFVYMAVLVNVLLGGVLFRGNSRSKWIALPVVGSLAFFLISNLGVWLSAGLYPRNFSGLLECYAMALPFYRTEALAELVYFVGLSGILISRQFL